MILLSRHHHDSHAVFYNIVLLAILLSSLTVAWVHAAAAAASTSASSYYYQHRFPPPLIATASGSVRGLPTRRRRSRRSSRIGSRYSRAPRRQLTRRLCRTADSTDHEDDLLLATLLRRKSDGLGDNEGDGVAGRGGIKNVLLASSSAKTRDRGRRAGREQQQQPRRERNKKTKNENKKAVSQQQQQQQQQQPDGLSYDDLSPLGRLVAGTVEVAVVTGVEFVSGWVTAYIFGCLTDVPRLLFRPVNAELRQPLFKEMAGRVGRLNAKSLRWGKSWGGISAAFGGFRVGSKVIRGGVEDEWNTVLSSMAAGAWFAREGGPKAMLRGALLYGGMVYLLSGNVLNQNKKQPFQYQDQQLADF